MHSTHFINPRQYLSNGGLLLTLLLAIIGLAIQPAYAAVNCADSSWSVADETDLNAAIVCFNAKGAGSYTITLTADIALTASTTAINNATAGVDLTIEGAGFAVDGQETPGVRVFDVAASTTVTMNEITVTGGYRTTTLTDAGGGIQNAGNLTLTASTVTGNSANLGAGIANSGTLNITNSTISGNNTGGGGGGLYVNGGTVTVSSSTIASNKAGYGGGIYQDTGTVTIGLSNTIVGDNTANLSGPDIYGTIISNDYNLVENTTGGTFTPQSHDQTGVDPILLALADNGGPTQTHALRADSPAVNKGDTALTVDQRGVARPQSSADDIGAFEREFTVSCSGTSWSVGSQAELDEAIVCYNAKTTAGTYTITLNQNIALGFSAVTIDSAITAAHLVIEGAGFTVDGQGISGIRPFMIETDTVVEMNDITIRGGRGPSRGGGIRNYGQLTINDSTITDNEAYYGGGGIANGDYNAVGTLTVNRCTISNNTAGVGAASGGGGISNWLGSITTINNSTFTGNTAGSGGGIDNFRAAVGGTPQISINNSTISGNTANAGGGIYSNGGTVAIDSSTITNNTGDGGLASKNEYTPVVTVKNSIIAHQASGADCAVFSGATITSNGHNISGDATCGFTGTGDQQNVSAAALNLGPLANNGGSTQTHALLAGSAAIDTGDTSLTTDQRGVLRPVGAADDIGAFESPINVTTTADELNTNGNCSLREAITNANDNAATYPDCAAGSGTTIDIINVPAGTYLLTLTGVLTDDLNLSGDLDSTDTAGLTLIGAGAAATIIDGNGTDRILDQTLAGSLALQDLTIQHGNVTTGGGGIQYRGTSGTLTLTNTYVLSNTTSKSGGGVSSNGGLIATNSRFIGNTAGEGGGGVEVTAPGVVTLNGGLFQGNVAAKAGGGVRAGGTLTVTATQFISNTAAFGGGLLANNTTLTDATLQGNQASTQGGGLLAQLDLTLSGTQFLNNSAPIGGGAAAYRMVTLSQVVTTTDELFVRGNWQHNGTLNQQGGAVKMGGTSAQTIAGSQPVNFANLEIANTNSAGVTLGSNITVTTHLTLTHDLYTTPAYRVNLTGGATTAGAGDVWGNSYREHAFAGSTAYAYGNPNVSIKFDNVGTLPNAILVELSKSQPTAFASAVTRAYTVTTTGGSGYAATLRLHYKDTELNGNSEPGLALFRYNGSTWDKQGRSAGDTSDNWLEQNSVSDLSAPWAIGASLDCTDSGWQVSDEVDLNAAIGCFNSQTVAGSYTITLTQNISLTAGIQAIANTTSGVSLVIEGGSNTVDGQDTAGVRPFEVAANTNVTMNDLTVTGGNVANEGGGILNAGALALNSVILNGNSADNHGGAIENSGSLTLTDSDINGNHAARGGGGLHNQGDLTVSGVTFRNNTAGSGTLGTGGGFQANSGTASFTNSTFSANQATGTTDDGGGAIMVYGGTVALHNVTIAGNSSATKGGGISVYNGIVTQDAAGGTLTMDNTLVGDNSASGSGPDVYGPITSNDYNLIENTAGATFTAQAHDITGKDPKLDLLANNGGNTLTYGLLTDSPAIDTGNTSLTVDQRGATRPTGLTDDIGAFEATAQEGTIIIRKSTAPAGAGGAGFVFDTSISGHTNFTLKDGGKESIHNVASGTYTVTEQAHATYKLSGLTCTDSSTGGTASTGDIASHTATINLDPGEIVSCNFVNAVDDSLTIDKVTIPDSTDTFNYLSNGAGNPPSSFSVTVGQTTVFTNVLPETYDLIEVSQPGYTLTSLSCTNADGDTATGDLNTGSVSVAMEAGDQWHCTSVSTTGAGDIYLPIIYKADTSGIGPAGK